MLFNSYTFLFVFLPIVLIGAMLIFRAGWGRAATAWLVSCSLFFYGWWNPVYLFLIGGSIIFNFALGKSIAGTVLARRNPKGLLLLGIGLNLGLLAYFKYFDFFATNVFDAVGGTFVSFSIILPLAISFFTFQQIAYLVDVSRGKADCENFLEYCLFVTFFPQLIAGPIVHYREMIPQFAGLGENIFRSRNIAIGLTIFFIGLFKKTVIADGMTPFVDPYFERIVAGDYVNMMQAWRATLAFSFQIYFDFSGYSDMAVGLARLFGVRLPINFASPYKARNIVEFWHRWHITLSRFLRDYLYIPLGGNRHGNHRRYANLVTTFLLGGLWHGAGWTFLLWGAGHGLGVAANHAWQKIKPTLALNWILGWIPDRIGSLVGWGTTFLFVSLLWVPFRAETIQDAGTIYQIMFGLGDRAVDMIPVTAGVENAGVDIAGLFLQLARSGIATIVLLLLWVSLLPNTFQIMARHDPVLLEGGEVEQSIEEYDGPRFQFNLRWSAFVAITAALAILGLADASEFIYFQF